MIPTLHVHGLVDLLYSRILEKIKFKRNTFFDKGGLNQG